MAKNIFTYSETWGPFNCEVPDCADHCFAVVVTPEDYELLLKSHPDIDDHPDGDRYEMSVAVIRGKQGVAVCDKHWPNI